MNIPNNFSPTWRDKVQHIFTDENVETLAIYNFLKQKHKTGTLVPTIELIFRNYNIDIHKIEGIIINDVPEINSNGLLFGSNEQSNRSLNNTYVQLKNTIYNKEDDWSFDHTLKTWSNQNLFLMNFNLTRDKEMCEQYKTFSLSILEVIHDLVRPPILVLGNYSSYIIKQYKLKNIIYDVNPYNESFKDSDSLLQFNRLLNNVIKY